MTFRASHWLPTTIGAALVLTTSSWIGASGTASAATPAALIPTEPARVLETRSGPDNSTVDGLFEGVGRAAAGSVIELQVAGRGGVADDAEAVMLNLTAILPDAPGYLQAYPCDMPRPLSSNVNHLAGQVVANAVLAKLDASGTVCIFTLAEAHIVADVNGYVPAAGSLSAVTPARLAESRLGPGVDTIDGLFKGFGRTAPGSITEVQVTGRGGVPDDADAAVLNVTAILPDDPGNLVVYACDTARPTASTINYQPGLVIANLALTRLSATGTVCVYTLTDLDVTIDVNGFVPAGGSLPAVDPSRVLETRVGPGNTTIDGLFEGTGKPAAGDVIELVVAGRAGVPDDAEAVLLNLAAILPDAPGYLEAYPCGTTRPTASNVNYLPGQVVANAVLAKIGTGGAVCIFTVAGADIVADVTGYVPTAAPPGTITIVKNTVGADGTFGFSGDLGNFDLTTLGNTASTTFTDVVPGAYAVSEADPSGLFASITSITCDDGASPTPSSAVPPTATVQLDPGEAVTCTFLNTFNFPPEITSDGGGTTAPIDVAENTTAVTDVDATDPEGETDSGGGLTYTLTGTDAGLFSIDTTGIVTFDTAPDHESPGDDNGDNDYQLTVTVTDTGTLTDTQDLTVTVTPVNEPPTITSDGGGPTANFTVHQGQTAVTDVDATDPEGETDNGGGLTYTLTGTDAGLFSIDAAGALTFDTAPSSAGTHDVTVTVTDSGLATGSQDITVDVPANTAPTAVDDTYSGLPVNVRLDAGTVTVGIDVDDADGVLTKGTDDNDGEDDALTVVGITGCADVTAPFTDCATTGGGTVTMNGDGTFTYISELGETAATDTFEYTISDGALTDTATVTIDFGSDTIWFIDNTGGGTGGSGASNDPFKRITDFNSASTGTGDIAYLRTGSTVYSNTGIVLTLAQRLIGEGAALTSGSFNRGAGTRPTLAPATGHAVTLASGNTVRGLDIGNTPAGHGITGVNVGSPIIDTVDITGAGGIIDISGGDLSSIALGTQTSTSSSGSGAINLQNTTGTYSGGSPTISGSTGAGIRVATSSGSISFTTVDITNSGAAGVTLLATGATIISFADLDVTNTVSNQKGIESNGGGGTLNVTTGTIDSGTATAVDVDNIALGVNLIRVDSVGGAAPGIDLVTTTGSFTVAGSTGGCRMSALSCSGGSITGKSGNVDGVLLSNVTGISLNHMNISSNSRNGVFGTNVNGFTIDDSRLDGNADQPSPDEAGLHMIGLTGDAGHPTGITNTLIANSFEHNAIIRNSTGTLTNLVVTNSTFGPNPTATGVNGLLFDMSGGTHTATITGSTFDDNRSNGLQATASSGTINVNVSTSQFTSSSQVVGQGQNVAINIVTSGLATANVNVSSNAVIEDHRSHSINIVASNSSNITGTIQSNTIGTAGDVASGSLLGDGIRASNQSSGVMTLLIDNNTVREVGDGLISGFYGISVDETVIAGTTNATITNNVIDQIRDDRGLDVAVTSGGTLCSNIAGNTFSNILLNPRLRQTFGSHNVAQASEAALEAANGGQDFTITGTVAFGQPTCTTP